MTTPLATTDIRFKATKDNWPAIAEALKALDLNTVLIGIPAKNAARHMEEGSTVAINNAALGYIHEFGAPEANIPARPFLIPGVKKILPEATEKLKAAILATLSGKLGGVDAVLASLGGVARDSVKGTITAGIPPPLQEATIKARLRRRRSWSLAKRQKMYATIPTSDFKPLIDTGALLNSISYEIRPKKA